MVHSFETKQRAIQLRTVERQSLKTISNILEVPLTTLSGWLKDFPIELSEQQKNRVQALKESKVKQRFPESDFSKNIKREFSRAEKGLIAETKVKLHLLLNGFEIFTPNNGTSKIDLVCLTPNNNLYKIQIKWVKNQTSKVGDGLPYIKLTHYVGATKIGKYTSEECDFFIGYDFRSDSIFVFSYEETKGKESIVVTKDAKDAWHKIQ